MRHNARLQPRQHDRTVAEGTLLPFVLVLNWWVGSSLERVDERGQCPDDLVDDESTYGEDEDTRDGLSNQRALIYLHLVASGRCLQLLGSSRSCRVASPDTVCRSFVLVRPALQVQAQSKIPNQPTLLIAASSIQRARHAAPEAPVACKR